MQAQNVPIDFVAYSVDGSVLLLAEAKTRHGTSTEWAAKLRRNMLAHGVLPKSEYFLIATPEKMYGWKQEHSSSQETPPQFTIDAETTFAPYFAKYKQSPANISPEAFELLVLSWLTDISRSPVPGNSLDAALAPLDETGLLPSLQNAQIEVNLTR